MYDLIGDIHGHADQLETLLQKLGYVKELGVYKHPNKRQVIFVGDFIDRGPQIRETLHLVKDMCDAGTALAIMGNHEYNAICFHTPHTERDGFFRSHDIKEIAQHIRTLEQFENYPSEWDNFLEWFKTLPLFLELDSLRVVHAYWNDEHIQWIRKNYKGITTDFLNKATDATDHSGVYTIIVETLKGKEWTLPIGMAISDKDGTLRKQCRVKWWIPNEKRKTYNDILMHCPDELKDKRIDSADRFPSYLNTKPVFFGHYCLNQKPEIVNECAICLDYCMAKDGVLVACRVEEEVDGITTTLIY